MFLYQNRLFSQLSTGAGACSHRHHSPASFTLRARSKWSGRTNCVQTDCALVSDLLPHKLPCVYKSRGRGETVKELYKQRAAWSESSLWFVSTGHGMHCGVRKWPLPSVMAQLERRLVFVRVCCRLRSQDALSCDTL